MKRFLIALLICFMPLCAQAIVVPDFISSAITFDAIGTYMAAKGFSRIDEEIRAYADPADYKYMQENGRGFYEINASGGGFGNGTYAFSAEAKNVWGDWYEVIAIDSSFFREHSDSVGIQSAIHHEVQHAKDGIAMSKEGYDASFFKKLDRISSIIYHSILEARAYSEQAVFVYNKMNALYDVKDKLGKAIKQNQNKFAVTGAIYDNKLKDTIDEALDLLGMNAWGSGSMTEENINHIYELVEEQYEIFKKEYECDEPNNTFFREAIEAGKKVEQARHDTAIGVLGSYFFAKGYISKYFKFPTGQEHLSAEEIIKILGNEFTLQDLYASDFWLDICSSKDTTFTNECKDAQKRLANDEICVKVDCLAFNTFFSKIIYNPDDRKLTTEDLARKVKKIIEIDKNTCGTKQRRKRVLTTEEDERKYKNKMAGYKICCTSEDWNLMWYTGGDPNYDYSIFK